MAPSCHFFARGNCRNGDACRYSHVKLKEGEKPVDRDKIESVAEAGRFLRSISRHKNADFVLDRVHLLRDKINLFMRDLAVAELRVLFEVLVTCPVAFDHSKLDELLRCLSANIIMSTLSFVNQVQSQAALVSCMRVLVEVGRVDQAAATLVPVEMLAKRAEALS
ncbi:hypothetical protein FOL47_000685 [Perkinsus chesapeaki]|uniref:C3H1-type domain-containing protein n=1 Tax=Perkinsus chesapeaki TaxID=330153 RepID=A0A7J6MMW1_PERCH|nr:hypothetical protein FOL47_000685 [Perkinsus chesapeaki]